jgi:hypothetical protein
MDIGMSPHQSLYFGNREREWFTLLHELCVAVEVWESTREKLEAPES